MPITYRELDSIKNTTLYSVDNYRVKVRQPGDSRAWALQLLTDYDTSNLAIIRVTGSWMFKCPASTRARFYPYFLRFIPNGWSFHYVKVGQLSIVLLHTIFQPNVVRTLVPNQKYDIADFIVSDIIGRIIPTNDDPELLKLLKFPKRKG